jgi:hypothetical protein
MGKMPPKITKAQQKAIDVAKLSYKKVFGKQPQGKSANNLAWLYGQIHERTTYEAAQVVKEAARIAQGPITQQQIDVNVRVDLRKDSDEPSGGALQSELSDMDMSSTDPARRFSMLDNLLNRSPQDMKHLAAELSEISGRQLHSGRIAGGTGRHLKQLEDQRETIGRSKAVAEAQYAEKKRNNKLISILIECVQAKKLLSKPGFVDDFLEAATAIAGRADFLIKDKAVAMEIKAVRMKKEHHQQVALTSKLEYDMKLAALLQEIKDRHAGVSDTPRPKRGLERSTTLSSQEFESQVEEYEEVEEADASAKIAELRVPTAVMYIGLLDGQEYGPVQVNVMSEYIKNGIFSMDVKMRSTSGEDWHTAAYFFAPGGALLVPEPRDFAAPAQKKRKTLRDMGRQNAMPNASRGGIAGMMGASAGGAADSADDFMDSL